MFLKSIILCLALSAAVSAEKNLRIIGGRNGSIEDFPYYASLMRISDDEHICGGVIISKLHVLTTAHCIDSTYVEYSNLKIRIGISRRTSLLGSTLIPNRIFTHPQYTGRMHITSEKRCDIALIRVKQEIQFNNLQQKVRLPLRDIAHNEFAVVSGWGATTQPPTGSSTTLRFAWMKVIETDRCKDRVDFEIETDEFCAFQTAGIGVGKGDGGSPLISNNRVIGLAITSHPYATGHPEIYINVYRHVRFIKRILNLG